MGRSTLRDIAEGTGYSIATVSRALSGFSRISGTTRQKILKYAHKIGYKEENCREIAVILPPGANFSVYWGTLIYYISLEVRRMNLKPVILYSADLDLLETIPFAGAISIMANDGLEKYWGKNQSMPLVCINTSPRHLDGVFSVNSNDEQGMTWVVEHLIKRGHRRIGRLGYLHSFDGAGNWNNFHRDVTFRELMKKYGLPDDLYVSMHSEEMVEVLKNLLQMNISALVLPHEGMASRVLHSLRLLNVRVPEDLSVVAWSHDYNAGYLCPAVTYVEQNYPELARSGCEMLGKHLNSEPVSRDILIDYLCYERASVADFIPSN